MSPFEVHPLGVGMTRVRMLVAYDGAPFNGFVVQPHAPSVAGEICEALAKVLGHEVDLVCAGRTDSGVHAQGQVIHFDTPVTITDILLQKLQRAPNKLLAPSIVVRQVEIAPEGFHARYSALTRTYRYTILNREVPDPFMARTSWHVEQPLDLRVMRLACDAIIGEHDFTSFCRQTQDPQASSVRKVLSAQWSDLGNQVLQFEVRSTSFAHQMVRALVGTMVEMGIGRKKAGDMTYILRANDRGLANKLAPPHGLCLWHVGY